jgi:hypothetical protein
MRFAGVCANSFAGVGGRWAFRVVGEAAVHESSELSHGCAPVKAHREVVWPVFRGVGQQADLAPKESVELETVDTPPIRGPARVEEMPEETETRRLLREAASCGS